MDPIERRNDELGRRIAELIRTDPRVIDQAKEILDRWIAGTGGEPSAALSEWRVALAMLEPQELAKFFESTTPRARRMRISSPFLVLVPRTQRIS